MALTQVTTGMLADASVTQAKMAAGVAGNGPAFSAYASAGQAVTGNVSTKVQINTEEYDTASAYDKDTNYRFQPAIAGYYQINGGIACNATAAGYFLCQLYKNGSKVKDGSNFPVSAVYGPQSVTSALIYLNGSTDYVELYAQSSASMTLATGAISTYFQGALVRAA